MKSFLSITFLTLALGQMAQADETEYWNALVVEQKINATWGLYNEVIYRHSQELQDYKLTSLRFGVSYLLTESLKGSYIIESGMSDNPNNSEFRHILQLNHSLPFDFFKLSSRFRFEYRRFADNPVSLNRLRGLVRLDFFHMNIAGWTPFTSYEHNQFANTVGSRLAGTQEARFQLGLGGKLIGGNLDVAYLDRRIRTPATDTSSTSEKRYHILNLSLKYALD